MNERDVTHITSSASRPADKSIDSPDWHVIIGMRNSHTPRTLWMYELVMVTAGIHPVPTVTLQQGNQFAAVALKVHGCPQSQQRMMFRVR